MAQIKCEYCGNFIDSSDSKCKFCGAPNDNLVRTADGTPKTIEELKDWYRARNLPDESVTRFFIGKNIKEPRAFGIYEENGKFVVYKNKDTGERAIRYQGTDEAYAVNELYMRLKQEILDQKARNSASRSNTASRVSHPASKTRRRPSGCLLVILANIALFVLIGIVGTISDDHHAQYGKYYLSDTNEIYYCDGSSSYGDNVDWWKYDKDTDEWHFYQTIPSKKVYPENVDGKNRFGLVDLNDKTGIPVEKLSIYKSHEYIDNGHHYVPNSNYYYYDDTLYYYLIDNYGQYYGSGNHSGWYKYDTDSGSWDYYCDYDDKESLGDELWYDEDKYAVDIDNNPDNWFNYTGDYNFDDNSFESTSWYQSKLVADEKHQKYVEEQEREREKERQESSHSWDNDSDYDWSSSDSWDSSSTDWGSDW